MSEFLYLDKFKKLSKIGQGGFGVVFKAKENGTENIYAAKISLSKFDEDPALFSDLKSEVNILLQLNHPSILRFVCYSPIDFDQENYPVIISEYSPNGTLSNIIALNRKLIPPAKWTDTKKLINIYGIASAMSYLHSHNIIHRDLKPANILEDDNFYPKIADFGISKMNYMNSKSEAFKGAPLYTAPEIWLNREYSSAGDVYAFSFIIYELLTLEEPFKNYKYHNLFSKVIIGGERPKFNFPIPPCYIDLITRCWSSDPKYRPTFRKIVEEFRTNKDFIIDTIDENEFYEFIDSIDEAVISFDSNKKLNIIPEEEKHQRDSEENNSELSEIEKLRTMSVGTFNSLSLKSQLSIISKMKEKEEYNEIIFNISKLLHYFEEFEPKSDDKYFTISEDDEETIETTFQRSIKISISYSSIDKINEHRSILSREFIENISKFDKVNIEIKYPTTTFEENYKEIIKLKRKYEELILINIYIDGIINTDMRFRHDSNIDSVIIGNDVNIINQESFSGCSKLKQVTIPPSITKIQENAFCECSLLKQIAIPSSVTKIGSNSFEKCSSLTQIIIPSSVIEIGKYAFCECSSLVQIIIPSSVIEIGECAFKKCVLLTRISIPSSVISIRKCAFEKCSLLRRISIPSSIIEISESAFSECSSLTQITIPSSVTSIGNYAFSECSLLAQITIPSSVTVIEDFAFWKCSSLTKITFDNPSNVNKIGKSIFSGCSLLKQILIPSSVTEIGDSAFSDCSALTQITFDIPSSITTIEGSTFDKCSSLTQITIPSSVIKIGKSVFSGCSLLKQIIIPSSVTEIGDSAFSDCSSLKQITFDNSSSVTEIRDNAFSGCSLLAQITIPSSVIKIGNSAFDGCSSLIQIVIPSSVTEIENSAFKGCSSLTQIVIPSSVTEIGNSAFDGCSSLTQIVIPSSTIKIGRSIFSGCSSLTQVTIPSSVTNIKMFSFSRCSSLAQITKLAHQKFHFLTVNSLKTKEIFEFNSKN